MEKLKQSGLDEVIREVTEKGNTISWNLPWIAF